MEKSELEGSDSLRSEKPANQAGVAREEIPKRERKIFFETKTLADVYAKQGHTSIALEICKRILQKNPLDSEAQNRVSELEIKLSPRREKFTKPQGDLSKESTAT